MINGGTPQFANSVFRLLSCFILAAASAVAPSFAQRVTKPDNPSSRISALTSTDRLVFFCADDGIHGQELWVHDPERAETRLVRDIFPGSKGSEPRRFHVYSEVLYFVADDGIHGAELWRSDGSVSGTRLVRDIYPGGRSHSRPQHFGSHRGFVFFVADDGRHGFELWRTNGTIEGTAMVKDIHPPEVDIGTTFPITSFGDYAYFRAASDAGQGELWRTDGTGSGTERITVSGLHVNAFRGAYIPLSDVIVFVGTTEEHGEELWKSDGTDDGTAMIRDIFPGSRDSSPSNLIRFRDRIFFQAQDAEHGMELWVTDGTTSGTSLVSDLAPGGTPSNPAPFRVSNDHLYFVADHELYGRELWVWEWGSSGPSLLIDMLPGVHSANPYQITPFRGGILFSGGHEEFGEELWFSDGAIENTGMVKDIREGLESAEPYQLSVVGALAYFEANDGRHGGELWRTDGSEEGTVLVADIAWPPVPAPSSEVRQIVAGNGVLYFVARRIDDRWHVWRNGSAASSQPEFSARPSSGSFRSFGHFAPAHDGLYFVEATPGIGSRLWYWNNDKRVAEEFALLDDENGEDSIEAVLDREHLIVSRFEGSAWRLWSIAHSTETPRRIGSRAFGSPPSTYIPTMQGLYFVSATPDSGSELWRLREGDVELFADINAGPGGSAPREIVSFDEKLYFVADDGTHGPELWVTNISDDADARMISDINPNPSSRSIAPRGMTALNDIVLFVANDGVRGAELWKTDAEAGTGAEIVKDIFPGSPSSQPDLLTRVGDVVYFRAEAPNKGVELWVTDGTGPGTHIVQELVVGAEGARPSFLNAVDGRLLFYGLSDDGGARAPAYGFFWTENGTIHEMRIAVDFEPGWDFRPGSPAVLDGILYFSANDHQSGRELWSIQHDKDGGYRAEVSADVMAHDRRNIAAPGEGKGVPAGF